MLRKSFVALAGAAVLFSAAIGESCSRVLWNNSGQNVLVGRNMDWFEDLKTNFYYLPRGVKHSGLSARNPAQWTNKYGSVLLTAYDAGVVDGVNEKGLSVNVLYLQETKTAPRDESIPGLCISMWGQYYLDQFATVKEAVEATHANPYQLQMATEPGSGKMMTVHLALNDPTGDSAIIECLDGKLKVYHSRDFTVMTNSPTFDKQLELLKQYEGFGGDKPLPGSSEAADRFVRGAYYAKQLPKAKSERDGIAALMSVMRTSRLLMVFRIRSGRISRRPCGGRSVIWTRG